MTFPHVVIEPCVTITPYSGESIGRDIDSASGSSITSTVSATYPTANLALFFPFSLSKPITVVKLLCFNGAVVNGNIDVGLYDVVGRRIISSGSTAQVGIDTKQEFDIPDTQLGPGIFYLAVAMDNIVGTLLRTLFSHICLPAFFGCAQMAAAFPLPDPAVFDLDVTNYIPLIGLTTRVLF